MTRQQYHELEVGETLIVTQTGKDRGKICTVIDAAADYRHIKVRLSTPGDTFSKTGLTERLLPYESLGFIIEPFEVIFDSSSPQWTKDSRYNDLFLNAQRKYFGDLLQARGYVFLNDILENCGLKCTRKGQVQGWTTGNLNMEITKREDNSFTLVFITEGNILRVFNN